MMQQIPRMTPTIMESLRRLDLIMPIKLFMPGIVPKEVDRQHTMRMGRDCLPITWIIRWLIPVSEARCLENSERVSYA
jgi:hypothetical protein